MQPGAAYNPQLPDLPSLPSLGETHNTMKSAIAALALGAVGTNAFVTPNAVVGRVATRSARQVLFFTFDVVYMCVCVCAGSTTTASSGCPQPHRDHAPELPRE